MNRREFQFSEGGSSKFWAIEVDGPRFTVRYGRLGTAGQEQTKEFGSDAVAKKAADKLIAEKTKKGYAEVGAGPLAASQPAPAKPKKAAAPAPAPPDAPAAVPLEVTHTIALDPTDWYLASWRQLPPLPLLEPAPAPFDRGEAIEEFRRFLQKDRAGRWWDWTTLRYPAALSPAAGRFLFEVFARLKPDGDKDKLAKQLARADLDTPLTADGIAERFAGMESSQTAERMLGAVRRILPAADFLRLLRDPRVLYWGWRSPLDILPWFMKAVLPYLPREELEAMRPELRREMKNGHWPQNSQQPRPTPAYYFAGPAGLHDELLALVRSWPDGSFGAKGVMRVSNYDNQPELIAFGLGSPGLVGAEARRIGLLIETPLDVRGWLACTEVADLDYVRDTIGPMANRPQAEQLFGALALVKAPEAAPHVLALRLESKVQKLAGDWLDANPGNAIAGLLPVAAGRGKLADAAVEYLRAAKKKGHADFIAAQLKGAPADVAAKVREAVLGYEEKVYELLDVKQAPKPLRDALAKGSPPDAFPAWPSLSDLPPLVVAGKRLDDKAVSLVLGALRRTPLGTADPLLAAVRAHAEPSSRDAFAWRLVERWLPEGAPSKDRWALASVGHLGTDATALRLTPLVRAWPGENQHPRAVLGLECLRAIGTDTALMQLNGIAQKLKFQGLKNKAKEFMEAIAKDKGLSREELEDRIVPDLDLDERGSRAFDYGPRQFRVVLGPDLDPLVRDESGKAKGDLPKPVAKDDAEKAAAAVEAWKLLKKQLREVLKVQAPRLEQAMVTGRRWPAESFEALLVRHPLMTNLARRLLWGGYDAKGKLVALFRVTEDQQYADADDRAFAPKGIASVGIVHPLHLTEGQRAAWGQVFGDYEIIPPFPQLGRPVFVPEKAEAKGKTIDRLAKRTIPGLSVRGTLEKLGWVRGSASDHGIIQEFTKHFPGGGVSAVLGTNPGIPIGNPDWTEDQQVERVFFLRGAYDPVGYSYHKEKDFVPLNKVDAVAVSEVLADVALLATKAK